MTFPSWISGNNPLRRRLWLAWPGSFPQQIPPPPWMPKWLSLEILMFLLLRLLASSRNASPSTASYAAKLFFMPLHPLCGRWTRSQTRSMIFWSSPSRSSTSARLRRPRCFSPGDLYCPECWWSKSIWVSFHQYAEGPWQRASMQGPYLQVVPQDLQLPVSQVETYQRWS